MIYFGYTRNHHQTNMQTERVTSYYMQIHYQFDLIYAFGARLQPELECLSLDWNERLMICNFPLGLLISQ